MVKAMGRPAASFFLQMSSRPIAKSLAASTASRRKRRRQANMRVFADDLDLRIAEIARHPGADRNRYAGLDQLRGLLDVQLDEPPDRFGFEAGHSPPHGVDVGAAFGHVLAKGAARIDTPGFEGACRQHSEGRAAADVGDLEPDALFGPYRRCGDIAVRSPGRGAAGS